MGLFLSPISVDCKNDVVTYPQSSEYTWPDTTHPSYAVNAVNPKVINITNWQGSYQQWNDLVGGYFADLTLKQIFRINDVKVNAVAPNTLDLYLNRACTGSGGTFDVITNEQCTRNASIMVRLTAGVCVVNTVTGNQLTLDYVGQRETFKPLPKSGYVEAILLDCATTAGECQASNSN